MHRIQRSTIHPLTACVLLSWGCSPGGRDVDGSLLIDAELTLGEDAPTVLRVQWNTGTPAHSWVEYGLDSASSETTPMVVSADGVNDLRVFGLKAGHSYTVRGVSELSDGRTVATDTQTVDIPARASGLPDMDISVADSDGMVGDGYVLMTILQQGRSWIALIDRDGDYVWWHDPGEGSLVPTVELARNGTDVLYSVYDISQQQDIGEVRRVSLADGQVSSTRTLLGHHDFAELPSGEIAWLAYDTRVVNVEGRQQAVTGDAIRFAQEGTSEEWNTPVLFSLMDGVTEVHPSCQHMRSELVGTGGLDWSHGNSLVYDEGEDAFYYMARHLDSYYKIDRLTGDVLMILRPPPPPQPGVPAGPRPWSHPHFSDAWAGGMVMFDNGSHLNPAVSAISHFSVDETTGRLTLEWHYEDPGQRFMPVLGDARRLPGGSYLTAWTSAGTIAEVTEQDEVTWQAEADLGSAIGRIQWVPDLYDLQASDDLDD